MVMSAGGKDRPAGQGRGRYGQSSGRYPRLPLSPIIMCLYIPPNPPRSAVLLLLVLPLRGDNIVAPCRYTSWGDFWKPVPASSDTARLSAGRCYVRLFVIFEPPRPRLREDPIFGVMRRMEVCVKIPGHNAACQSPKPTGKPPGMIYHTSTHVVESVCACGVRFFALVRYIHTSSYCYSTV